ncbi:MAG: hypothetical protein ACFHWX_06000 [Bacteroidota bacterium]
MNLRISFLMLAACFFAVGTTYAQSSNNLVENYLREYNPQSYSYFKYGEGIVSQGKQMASSLAGQLNSYKELINTTDPNQLLQDFNYKMQNIQSLQIDFGQQYDDMVTRGSQDLVNQVKSGDGWGAAVNFFATASALSSMDEEARQIEARKNALIQQRNNEMKGFLNKALELNDQNMHQYLRLAGYAENLQDEKYYLEFAKHLQCHGSDMQRNYTPSNTNWLNNSCSKPIKPDIEVIENKFIPKDRQYSLIARRKFEFFLENKSLTEFRDGAISFTAAAANLSPKAEYYFQLGEYYSDQSTILSLTALLTAKSIYPGYFDPIREEVLEETQRKAVVEIAKAIRVNNQKYLNAFLDAGLDRTLQVENKSLLSYAISLDRPDAVQLILNKYIDGLSESGINQKIQKTIMLCAVEDSPECLQRFIDLGVDPNFQIGNYTPVDVAARTNSLKAFKLLLANSNNPTAYREKYKTTNIFLLEEAISNPESVSAKINSLSASQSIDLAGKLIDGMVEYPNYFIVLEKSPGLQSAIKSNAELNQKIRHEFAKEVGIPTPKSKATRYLKSGLVELDHLPLKEELLPQVNEENVKMLISEQMALVKSMLDEHQAKYDNIEEHVYKKLTSIKYTDTAFEDMPAESQSYLMSNTIESEKKILDIYINSYSKTLADLEAISRDPDLMSDKTKLQSIISADRDYASSFESIAYIAFFYDNYELFAELDRMFDLSEAKNKHGEPIINLMLRQQNRYIGSNPIYVSKDFASFNAQNKEQLYHKILTHYRVSHKSSVYDDEALELLNDDLESLKKIFNAFNTPIDTRFGLENKTMLHIYADSLLSVKKFSLTNMSSKYSRSYMIDINLLKHIHLVRQLGIDPSITDSSGKKASDIFDEEVLIQNILNYKKEEANTARAEEGMTPLSAKDMANLRKELLKSPKYQFTVELIQSLLN